MAPPSNTPKKRLMIVNCAPANFGKSNALKALRLELLKRMKKALGHQPIRKKDFYCYFEKQNKDEKDHAYLLHYSETVIAIFPAGDEPDRIKKNFNTACQWIETKKIPHKPMLCMRSKQKQYCPDIFITAAHPERGIRLRINNLARTNDYQRNFKTHEFLPDNKGKRGASRKRYVAEVMFIIDEFIKQRKNKTLKK